MREGNQGPDWKVGQVELTLEGKCLFRAFVIYLIRIDLVDKRKKLIKYSAPASAIFIEAVLRDWSYGDICIDDIQVRQGRCAPLPVASVKSSAYKQHWTEWSSCLTSTNYTCQGVQTRQELCIPSSSANSSASEQSNETSEHEIKCENSATQTRDCIKPECRCKWRRVVFF